MFDSNDFCVYRCDRSEANSTHERFGGVVIAVRTGIPSEKIIVPQTEDVELVVVKLRISRTNVYVCNLYIPSNSPIAVYQRYVLALERVIEHIDISIEDRLYVLGDFNMSDVRWLAQPDGVDFLNDPLCESNCLLPFDVNNSAVADLLHCLLGAGLSQTNAMATATTKITSWIWFSVVIQATSLFVNQIHR